MNKFLLNKEVQDFINQNLNADITKLILKGSPFKNVTIQEIATQIISKKKCEKKLPTWFKTEGIYYPNKLNIEQTSSEETANYKANLVKGNSFIDLTGGFGVDSYYFAQRFNKVIHCEINADLSEIVKHNFKCLNVVNTIFENVDGLEYLKAQNTNFDCIYIDPSRRDSSKGKVFLLEDCIPNIPKEIDFLMHKTKKLILKYSPILDIEQAINSLKYVTEIHITAIKNDVKELLFILQNQQVKNIKIYTINKTVKGDQLFNFDYHSNVKSNYSLPKSFLYEPNSAILKAGAFHQISNSLNLEKLHQHSHLYTSNELIKFPGRTFIINYCVSYDKKVIKRLIPTGKANITTRNFPETVEKIRKKTKLKDGGNDYLFFTTNINNELVVLVCKKTS